MAALRFVNLRTVMWLAMVAAIIGLGLTVWTQGRTIETRTAERDEARHAVTVLSQKVEQAREAQAVADAYRLRNEQRANEYEAVKEALMRGDSDADLPEWFCDALRDLGFGCLQP